MLNEPRIYRHSSFQTGLVIFIFGLLLVGLIATIGGTGYFFLIPFMLIFGVVFLVILMTRKAILSEDEISTQGFLGIKTLRWSEISRVSGSGYAIKLHNFDGDVTVAPSPQLPGYEELVGWIGLKRPDLFNPLEYGELTKGLPLTIFPPLMGLLIIGIGYFAFLQDSSIAVPFIIFSVIGLVLIGSTLASPRKLSLQGKSLEIGYLFRKPRTVSTDEVASIDLRFTQTRNGKNYFVMLNLVNKATIRISGLGPSLPIVFLVLRNWNKKSM